MAGLDRLQSGEPVADVPSGPGTAQEDRALAADQPATTVGEGRRPAGQARPVLLADAGGESSDQAGVRGDGGKDRRLAGGDGAHAGGGAAKPRGKEGKAGEALVVCAEEDSST